MIAPGNHGDFGFAARSTTPGEGFAGQQNKNRGQGEPAPGGVRYGVAVVAWINS